jgi:nucleoside-diphosphate-sugar epimerase
MASLGHSRAPGSSCQVGTRKQVLPFVLTFSFLAATNNTFPGSVDQIRGFVHVQDVAKAYVLAATNPAARGQIFNLVGQNQSPYAILRAIGKVVGYTGPINVVGPDSANPFSEILVCSQLVDSRKAKVLLGWDPRQPDLLGSVEKYYNTWKAYQQ